MKIKCAFVFDVESIGLHGEGFAVAGGIYFPDGSSEREFRFAVSPEQCAGESSDREWVAENIPPITKTHTSGRGEMLLEFFGNWLLAKKNYPEIIMAAECGWPVEARFLAECVDQARKELKWLGPYPFHEIASFMFAAGMDPTANYDRLPRELPKHDPLADSRQSARLLFAALGKLDLV